MAGEKIEVVFLLSKILGNATFSGYVKNAVKEMPFIEPHFIYFSGEDYQNNELPTHIRKLSRGFASETIWYKYTSRYPNQHKHLLFINSFELIRKFRTRFMAHKSIVALDSTNTLGHYLVYNRNKTFLNYLRYRIVSVITSAQYKSVVPLVTHFLPRTTWCADSLKKQYKISEHTITVCPGGIDTDLWAPTAKKTNTPPQLLFVGNDFYRKGGDLLTSVYLKYLQGKARIVIISNDPCLSRFDKIDGLTIIQNLSHHTMHDLINVYNQSDIFIFPSKNDRMGQVLLEASSMGLPIIGSDIGGSAEIIRHNKTGFLMPYNSTEKEWSLAIQMLLDHPQLRQTFGKNARQLALEHFSKNTFAKKLEGLFLKINAE